jgi:hypothetical protein
LQDGRKVLIQVPDEEVDAIFGAERRRIAGLFGRWHEH